MRSSRPARAGAQPVPRRLGDALHGGVPRRLGDRRLPLARGRVAEVVRRVHARGARGPVLGDGDDATGACAPVGARALAGLTVTLHEGTLSVTGDASANVITAAGTGVAKEVAVGDGSSSAAVVYRCVTDIVIDAGAGDDVIRVGGPNAFNGITSLTVQGGSGSNSMSIQSTSGINTVHIGG